MNDIYLNKKDKIAFICSPQFGDSLIGMVTVYNLRRNGCNVTVFSNYLTSLADWFPNDKIHPMPNADDAKNVFTNFDVLIFTYPHDINNKENLWHPRVIILAKFPEYTARTTISDIQVMLCKKYLNLKNPVRFNNLVPPKNLIKKKYQNRIVMHPTSRNHLRNWPAKKFLKLAKLLKKDDFVTHFVVSPAEYPSWRWIEAYGFVVMHSESLADVAQLIYESRLFIGNDSGIGHLASNVGTPTISLILRRSLARQWRPSWANGTIILPSQFLITRPLKEHFWKHFVSVKRVYNKAKQFLASDN